MWFWNKPKFADQQIVKIKYGKNSGRFGFIDVVIKGCYIVSIIGGVEGTDIIEASYYVEDWLEEVH